MSKFTFNERKFRTEKACMRLGLLRRLPLSRQPPLSILQSLLFSARHSRKGRLVKWYYPGTPSA